ncbi:SMP-30/gluconolactonase/LRE family protein [uncultured Microbacterium sp.]|uniref:SMP-30/gluconolactonase/LRE family protein n=1 Tax=uncultured Microbacterium sp. TaxID=191216 RepID=UPI0035C9C9FD
MIRIEAQPDVEIGNLLGEGPFWWRDRLIWVDLLNGILLRRDHDGGWVEVLSRDSGLSVAVPRRNGGLALLAGRTIELLDADLNVERIIPVPALREGERLADATAGPAGELWFGSIREDLTSGGCLFRLRPNEQSPQVVLTGVGLANGLGFAPDARTLYFVDSAAGTVTAFDYDPATQELSRSKIIATIDPADGSPDGITVDAAGSIWVALWAGGCVRRLDADGTWSQEVLVPAPNVTSCALGGEGLNILYITTGTVEMDTAALDASPLAGSLFATPVPVPGLPALEIEL